MLHQLKQSDGNPIYPFAMMKAMGKSRLETSEAVSRLTRAGAVEQYGTDNDVELWLSPAGRRYVLNGLW
jgi:hypothetical protein